MDQNIFAEYYPSLFLFIGIAFLSFSIFGESKNSKLKQTGVRVEGIVFEQGFENNSQWSFIFELIIRAASLAREWIICKLKLL